MEKKKILCLHGFGKRRGRQFEVLREAFGDCFEILSPDYYELNKEDASCERWLNNVKDILEEYKEERPVVIGFSMGALMASHFSREYGIEKMIFLSPGLDDQKFLEIKRSNPDPAVPDEYIDVFPEVLKRCLPDVEKIDCPVTFVAAKGDELIPYEFSVKYYEKIDNPDKKLYLLEGGSHTILDDPETKEKVLEILKEELQPYRMEA
ncbi:MAG: alpha/beta hydrolase [Erysipelotrichaceae bacterium]|nr:alpha/beta hydrolase [Erysipelotrichaceae bacterium]